MAYAIVIEETRNGFSAYVPELPGCVAAAETRDETIELLIEAIDLHLEALDERHNYAFGVLGIYGFKGRSRGSVVLGERTYTYTPMIDETYPLGRR